MVSPYTATGCTSQQGVSMLSPNLVVGRKKVTSMPFDILAEIQMMVYVSQRVPVVLRGQRSSVRGWPL